MVLVKFYDSFSQDLGNGDIVPGTDSFEFILTTSAYTFSEAHSTRADITNELSTGGGYTAGGTALANESLTQDAANDRSLFDFDDVVISNATLTFRHCIVFKDGGGAASTDRLVCDVDFETDQSPSAADYTIALSSSPAGLFEIVLEDA